MEQREEGLDASQATAGSAPSVFGQRYQVQQPLGQGQIIETLLGVDLQTNEQVVIKALPAESINAGIRMRLEHEAAILLRMDTPLLAPLLSAAQQDGLFYMVSRYQAGTSLETLLSQRRLSVAETLAVGQCVLRGLQEGHEHDVLHRHVKPANVILEGTSPVCGAVLVEFGLIQSSQLEQGSSDPPLEAARYVSPEQAGLLDAEIAGYSDLYCTGIVLFECLAGRPPFDGRTIGEILRQHMTTAPPELRRLELGVPRALDEVVQRLLLKDPRDRYQRAAAALADVEAIVEALGRGEEEPAVVVGLQDRRQSLTEPAFVGRERELQALQMQLRKAEAGRGGLVLLEAESGGGKTRLLGELALRCRRQDVWVLHGRAFDQIGQQPFQVLEGIADEILATCRAEPQRAPLIREAVGDRLEAVVAVQPRLAEVLGGTPTESLGPEVFGEARTIDALVTFLLALGSQDRPALILLDDCQWVDEPTLKLFRRWQSRRRMERGVECHALLVAAYRTEEVREGHVLRSLSPVLHLQLPPFDSPDIRQLAESMAGRLPVEAVEVIERLSAGSPFMASAVLRGMVESRALIPGERGWRVERSAMDDVRSSRHAAEVLARRIALLPRVATDLLKVAAVLGKEFDLPLADSLAGLLPGHTLLALKQAQQRHLVWTRPDGERCVFVHDKVRETCLNMLGEEERKELHLRAAAQLEQREPPPVFDLAYHYDVAGQSERALPYALAAAERARAQHSLEIAEQQYHIALRGSADADQSTCYRIAEGLGDMLMLRGHYETAWQMFEAAKFLALGDVAWVKAKIEGKLGELIFKRGDMKMAAIAIGRGLGHLGCWVPHWSGWYPLLLVWEVVVQTAHTLVPSVFLKRRSLKRADRALLSVHLYSRLGHAYWFARGKVPTLWAHLREMNLAECYPPTLELAQAYSEHAPAMSLVPYFSRGIAYAEKSREIRRDSGDVWGQAQSLHYLGIVLYAASRFEDCIDKCREAVRLFERTGDYWEMNMARYQIAASLYRLGDLASAVDEAKRLHKSGVELGDIQASGISLDVWAWASGGRVPADILQTELARERDDAQATAQVLVAEGVRLLNSGYAAEAVESLEKARRALEAAGVKNAWVAPVLPWLATALRRQAEDLSRYAPARRKALLKKAELVVRQALRNTRGFRNDLPHALREKALLLVIRGRARAARRWFDRSLAEAERQGARHERAQTLLYRGRVGNEWGWSGADRDVAEAEQLLARLHGGIDLPDDDSSDSTPGPTTLSLVDRFEKVLDAGRSIASSLSRDAVFLSVREAAVRLLRGEECFVWRLPPAPSPDEKGDVGRFDRGKAALPGEDGAVGELVGPTDTPHGNPPDQPTNPAVLQSFVRRALQAERTIVYSEESDEGTTSSAELAAIRSALCTPVFVRGTPAACFCVVHRQITALFREDEQRLADFIAAIAGAALENAEGFEKLQQMNVILEQRVDERTADLQTRTEELARSNNELEQFAYAASHDLQEPLRTVAGYCRLLEDLCVGQEDQKARDYAGLAVDGATRMKTLINDLLAYSRVGRVAEPFESTDSEGLLDQALANLSVVIEETDAVVTRTPLPQVMGDKTLLLQLFQNLVDNAVKFRGGRRGQVHVAAERRGDEWLFSIQDNGIGIPPDDCERVFMVFHRLHAREKYSGTGIGLAMCKKAVEHHGGRIWVESEEGRGSTFFFTLPAVEASDA